MQRPISPTVCRLLVDPAAPGAWNMAVDEVLWQGAAREGECCWRFYRWSEPTLSLGYFQAYQDRLGHPASRDAAVVRRISGGGAILHDAELTYSFVVPSGHGLAARRQLLYRDVHQALIEALADFGIQALLCREGGHARVQGSGFRVQDAPKDWQLSTLNSQHSALNPQRQPFLCFQRRSPGDVLLGGAKIAGSAQRRSRGAVLQHGSVLLRRSPAAPELAGLSELASNPPSDALLVDAWRRSLRRRLDLSLQPESLGEAEREQAGKLVQARYGSLKWTKNRGR